MKYTTIIETDDYKDFKFYEDAIGKYMVGKDANATSKGGWIPLYFTECKQESKTGHWINKAKKSGCGIVFYRIECSECGEPSGLSHMLAKYCPNCGAKMIESEE